MHINSQYVLFFGEKPFRLFIFFSCEKKEFFRIQLSNLSMIFTNASGKQTMKANLLLHFRYGVVL